MGRIRERLKIKSFVWKIWLTIFLCFLILAVFISCFFQFYYRGKLLEDLELQCAYEDEIYRQSVERYTDTANSCVNTIILNLNGSLSASDLNGGYPRNSTNTQKKIYRCLLNTFRMFRDPVEVMILWNNGNGFYQYQNFSMTTGETELLRELQSLPITRQGFWLTKIKANMSIGGTGIYYLKPYTDLSTGSQIGYVILKLAEFDAGSRGDFAYRSYYLFDRSRMLIQTTDEAARASIAAAEGYANKLGASRQWFEKLTGSRKDENDIFYSEVSLDNQWTMIRLANRREVLRPLEQTMTTIMLALVIALLLIFSVVGMVVERTFYPIRRLSRHMLENRGNLPDAFPLRYKGKDEFGVLIDSYNQMTRNNRELFEQTIADKQTLERLEFSLLQSQIKPHFLYNSLDAVYCLIAVGRHADARAMTKLLSDYYRLSLSNGMERVSLREELEITRLYLEIQSVRYRSTLSFDISCDENVPPIELPKLTLQPLVENAIYHGIKPKGAAGQVKVSASFEGGTLEIRVMDDGVGFAPADFERVISQEAQSGDGYGLRNVVKRLQLYFESECSIELEPVTQGTSICIRIRVRRPAAAPEERGRKNVQGAVGGR